ncbi:MAG: hypothetical protein M1831_004821 [Alyxoria varia]|nr:MAG: hypothetical protein M1831_004821 [Alyxoria varia]
MANVDAPLRSSICFAKPASQTLALPDHDTFNQTLASHIDTNEAKAQERMIQLKRKCRSTNNEDVWQVLCKGLTQVFDAQWAFVTKREDETDLDGASLIPIGEEGSHFVGISWYYDDKYGNAGFGRNLRYRAWGGPCSFMKHDKVFIIAKGLKEFTPSDPNQEYLPIRCDSYIGVPLFNLEGNCFAHFGVLWTAEGEERKTLRWGFIEAMLHSIDDMVTDRLLERESLELFPSTPPDDANHGTNTPSSLKPYAQTLSHELRTPMQGVVGMLDLMHSDVEEISEHSCGPSFQNMLDGFKTNIEVIQDSSRRAVEAAENVAHAYDLNLDIPPTSHPHQPPVTTATATSHPSPSMLSSTASLNTVHDLLAGSSHGTKRKFSESSFESYHRPRKLPVLSKPLATYNDRRSDLMSAVEESEGLIEGPNLTGGTSSEAFYQACQEQSTSAFDAMNSPGNGMQYIKIHDFMAYIVGESLKVGGRPETTSSKDTARGRVLQAIYRHASGRVQTKDVEWTIDATVPDTILVHEKNYAKLISCVFQNALKFTENGKVDISMTLDRATHAIITTISDNGRGIQPSFQDQIFKPFTKEDNSISRMTEGLGLGLLVAKGLSRKLGGDLVLVRSETEGPNQGAVFEIRIPVFPNGFGPPLDEPFGAVMTEAHHQAAASPPKKEQIPEAPATSSIGPISKSDVILDPPPPSRRSSKVDSQTLAATHPLTFLVAEDNIINRSLLVNMLVKLGYDRKTQIYEAYDGADAFRQANAAAQRRLGEDQEDSSSAAGNNPSSPKGPIDIILMDLWMPKMDGYEATERILALYNPIRQGMRRAISEPHGLPQASKSLSDTSPMPSQKDDGEGQQQGQGLPLEDSARTLATEETPAASVSASNVAAGILPPTILAVTADATEGAAERASKVGMDGFMAKPYNLRDLERLVKEGWVKRQMLKTKAK